MKLRDKFLHAFSSVTLGLWGRDYTFFIYFFAFFVTNDGVLCIHVWRLE